MKKIELKKKHVENVSQRIKNRDISIIKIMHDSYATWNRNNNSRKKLFAVLGTLPKWLCAEENFNIAIKKETAWKKINIFYKE